MNTKTAVNFVMKHRKDSNGNSFTKYSLAKEVGCESTSIYQWMRRTKMGPEYREIFRRKFGVIIND